LSSLGKNEFFGIPLNRLAGVDEIQALRRGSDA